MAVTYDKYYQSENLFGEPYPELIQFFEEYHEKGRVLDLGCGQGRDAIALARLGYSVVGVDNSTVGIDQMNKVAKGENLSLQGKVGDIYTYDHFQEFDAILLDSMFHFQKKDREKEVGLVHNVVSKAKEGCIIAICIQDTGKKVQMLNEALDFDGQLKRVTDKSFTYIFEDSESGHRSETAYRMVVARK